MENAILEMEMWSHRLCVSSTWLDNAKLFSKCVLEIVPPSIYGNSVAYILTDKSDQLSQALRKSALLQKNASYKI